MKKRTAVLLLLLGFLSINAQNKTRVGLKAGLNISTLNVSGITMSGTVSRKTGFHIGGFLAVPVGKKVEIHPEILYSNQGYKYKETNSNGTYTSVANINYFAIPIMVVYAAAKKFNIEIGPQVSFLVDHKAKVTFDSTTPGAPSQTGNADYGDTSQSIEVGVNAGVSYQLTKNIFFSGRYNFGISTVNKKYENSDFDNEKDRNSVFQFSVGYLFN